MITDCCANLSFFFSSSPLSTPPTSTGKKRKKVSERKRKKKVTRREQQAIDRATVASLTNPDSSSASPTPTHANPSTNPNGPEPSPALVTQPSQLSQDGVGSNTTPTPSNVDTASSVESPSSTLNAVQKQQLAREEHDKVEVGSNAILVWLRPFGPTCTVPTATSHSFHIYVYDNTQKNFRMKWQRFGRSSNSLKLTSRMLWQVWQG